MSSREIGGDRQSDPSAHGATSAVVRATVSIRNSRGLHARASAKFVRCAESFDARISVSRDGQTVNATSIMGLMMLGAGCGSEIEIEASGRDADDAVTALKALVAGRFGEAA